MDISHTIEQLEAARMHQAPTEAVRILKRHHLANKMGPAPLNHFVDTMRAYWQNPATGIQMLIQGYLRKPNR